MIQRIKHLTEKHLDSVIAVRRDIHQYPELGMEEERTSELVALELEKLGLPVQRNIGNTGVVAILEGKPGGKTLLLRADMDALPIQEATDLPFKSKKPGLMHACGHDVHTSILLGVAKVLTEAKDLVNGTIKFVFQPAEEANPTGGARYMIEDGVLENPSVDAAMALHVWDNDLGTVGIRKGTMMARSDRLYIKVKGKSSHASQPQKGVDAIVAAAQIISALQTVISRNVDPMDSAVITLGTIHGGSRYNVLCDEVTLEGTVRIFDDAVARLIPQRIHSVVEGIAAAMGCEAETEYVSGYGMTVNDPALAAGVMGSLVSLLGKDKVLEPAYPASGGEDFSEFTKRVPSVYYWLGMKSELNEGRTILHNPDLLIDERCMPIGISTMAAAAIDYLNGTSS